MSRAVNSSYGLVLKAPLSPARLGYVLTHWGVPAPAHVTSHEESLPEGLHRIIVSDAELKRAESGRIRVEISDGPVALACDAAVPANPGGAGARWCRLLAADGREHPLVWFTRQGSTTTAFIGFSLVEAAFDLLSGAAERRSGESGIDCRSYHSRIAPVDPRVLLPHPELPEADILGLIFRETAKRLAWVGDEAAAEPLRIEGGRAFQIALTHDVDVLEKDLAVRVKKGGVSVLLALKALLSGRPGAALDKLRHASRLGFAPASYATISEIRRIESSFGFRSTFFLSAHSAPSSRSGWLDRIREPRYALDEEAASNAIREIVAGGDEVGLHGSIASSERPGRLQEEKSYLERVCGRRVRSQRAHWLSFRWDRTPAGLGQAKFDFDATLAYVDRPGFRAGTTHPYRLFDTLSDRESSVTEIPTVFMDMSMLLRTPVPRAEEIAREAIARLDWVRRFGGRAAINWHPECFSDDYGWAPAYVRILEWIRDAGGRAGRLDEIA